MIRLIDVPEELRKDNLFSDIRELVNTSSKDIYSGNFHLVTATQDINIRDSVNVIRAIMKEEEIIPTYYSKNGRGNFMVYVYNNSDAMTIHTEVMPNVTTHRMIINVSDVEDIELRYFDNNNRSVVNRVVLAPYSIVLMPVDWNVTISPSFFAIIDTVITEK